MKVWKLLPTISAAMPFQMAFDEILFQNHSVNRIPMLRFYYSDGPWATVGYSKRNQAPSAVPRITGGGVVEHGKDLIFSLAAHKQDDETFHSVRARYWKIHEAVKMGLEAFGQIPRFYRCDENLPKGEDCFQFPIATDLAMGNHKVAGGAQKRSNGMLLHQESIQYERFASGNQTPQDYEQAIREGFEKVFGVKLELTELNPEWLKEARLKVPGG